MQKIQRSNELEHELSSILHARRIHTLYQPLVNLSSGKVMGYEALTRGPSYSALHSPLKLFSAAEQFKKLDALERLAQETAIVNAKFDSDEQLLFINFSSQLINSSNLVSLDHLELLQRCGFSPSNIVFEITERSSIEDFEQAKRFLDKYRKQGYRIAIDDAGIGYSSLHAIAQIHPDYIKIDRSLIQNVHQDVMKKHLLEAFVTFTQRMNIGLVAEGIEQEEELALLTSMGVQFAQGYLLARPHQTPPVIPSHIVQFIHQHQKHGQHKMYE